MFCLATGLSVYFAPEVGPISVSVIGRRPDPSAISAGWPQGHTLGAPLPIPDYFPALTHAVNRRNSFTVSRRFGKVSALAAQIPAMVPEGKGLWPKWMADGENP